MVSILRNDLLNLVSTKLVYNDPVIKQFSFGVEKTNSYLLVSGNHGLLIDVCSETVVGIMENANLTLDYVILTHEHADHLWGLNALRKKIPELKVIAQDYCSRAIGNSKLNKASSYRIYAILRFGKNYVNKEAENRNYICKPADITFFNSFSFEWQQHRFVLKHTPGHSPGSCLVSVDDKCFFTGDTILRESTFLKFEGGDENSFVSVTVPILDKIKNDAIILPGHGDIFLKQSWMS